VLRFDDISNAWETHADRLLLIMRAHGDFAEDAVQEAFLALARQPQMPESPLAWLIQVARNHIRQHYRTVARQEQRHTMRAANHAWFAFDSAEDNLTGKEAAEAMENLPTDLSEVVMMHIWGELTFSEIGAIIDSSRATAHRRYQEAIELLREQFDDDIRPMKDGVKHERP